MPLETISEGLLIDAPEVATSLDAETKSKLIQMIDRRERGIWGRIKQAIT